MKFLLVVSTLLFSFSVFAKPVPCETKADNDYFYAEVISRGHMDLELTLILKDAWAPTVKVIGGLDASLPATEGCDGTLTDLTWLNNKIAIHSVQGGNNIFYANYRICVYGYGNKLVSTATICNSETGD